MNKRILFVEETKNKKYDIGYIKSTKVKRITKDDAELFGDNLFSYLINSKYNYFILDGSFIEDNFIRYAVKPCRSWQGCKAYLINILRAGHARLACEVNDVVMSSATRTRRSKLALS